MVLNHAASRARVLCYLCFTHSLKLELWDGILLLCLNLNITLIWWGFYVSTVLVAAEISTLQALSLRQIKIFAASDLKTNKILNSLIIDVKKKRDTKSFTEIHKYSANKGDGKPFKGRPYAHWARIRSHYIMSYGNVVVRDWLTDWVPGEARAQRGSADARACAPARGWSSRPHLYKVWITSDFLTTQAFIRFSYAIPVKRLSHLSWLEIGF